MVIISGIITAVLTFFSPGSSFILLLAILTIFFINRLSNKSERDFLLGVFLVGFGARVALVLLTMAWSIFSGHILNYASEAHWRCPDYSTPYIIDDSGYYTLRSLYISMYWLGKPLTDVVVGDFVKSSYGFTGFTYILASYFTLFGYSPISSRFINCFLGVLTAILVYSIVKNTFGEKPARISAILTVSFPSLFLWSITNLKESSFIFSAYLMLWSIIKFRENRKIYYLIITSLSIWLQFVIRAHKEFLYLVIAIISIYFFCLFILNLYNRKKIIFLIILFMICSFLVFSEKGRINSALERIIQRALIAHAGAFSTGGICYKLLPDEFYTTGININYSDFLKMLSNGWLHILFEPFPWKIQTKPMLFSFPQIILWYLLIPFAILGMGISVRYRLKETLILFIYFFTITSVLAVTGSNIGTIFRFRDAITPILLIFSSVGLINTFSSFNLNSR